MKIVAQMDDLTKINYNTDSTFAILFAAQSRGHEIFYYQVPDLSYDFCQNKLKALVKKVELVKEKDNHCKIIEQAQTEIADFDVVLLRQDPPFNMQYITTTYLLEKVMDRVLILNNPTHVRNCPEKLMVSLFPQLTPPTLFTNDKKLIKDFYDFHGDIILKPLYGNGGEGIMFLKKGDQNFSSMLDLMTNYYDGLILAQKFLPNVSAGDKRIILVDGEIAGSILRIPPNNEIRSNLHIGGSALKANLTPRDQEICSTIKNELKERGLFFVGIDIIGDYLTEINVTSPTGINEIKKIENKDIAIDIIRAIEQKLASK